MTTIFEKLYRCELIQDNDAKNDCLKAIPNDELITSQSWCEELVDEIDIMGCSEKYNNDSNSARSYKCVLDKLWYQLK